MFDPPDEYWHKTGRSWAELVKQPPPDDLIAVLNGYPDMCQYGIFVDVARQLTGATSVATSAVRRAGAALGFTDTAPGIQPCLAPHSQVNQLPLTRFRDLADEWILTWIC